MGERTTAEIRKEGAQPRSDRLAEAGGSARCLEDGIHTDQTPERGNGSLNGGKCRFRREAFGVRNISMKPDFVPIEW